MIKTASDHYLMAHIVDALATDERTSTLDVRVHISSNGEVVVSGVVACVARRAAAEEVVRELLPGDRRVVNRLRVQAFSEPAAPEPVNG